jgi:hypothetical protein
MAKIGYTFSMRTLTNKAERPTAPGQNCRSTGAEPMTWLRRKGGGGGSFAELRHDSLRKSQMRAFSITVPSVRVGDVDLYARSAGTVESTCWLVGSSFRYKAPLKARTQFQSPPVQPTRRQSRCQDRWCIPAVSAAFLGSLVQRNQTDGEQRAAVVNWRRLDPGSSPSANPPCPNILCVDF